jgi:hypothetical protein
MSEKARKTPVRGALRQDSILLPNVKDGLGDVKAAHRQLIDGSIRTTFVDSLEIDDNLKPGRDQENRWDYLLGHGPSGSLVALEPHSAKDDQVSTVIRKREAALKQLGPHLRDGARIEKWLWVASGAVYFARTEKVSIRLIQSGIEFVGKMVTKKHIAFSESPPSRAASTRQNRKK